MFKHSKLTLNTIFVGPGTNEKHAESLSNIWKYLVPPRHLYVSHAVYSRCIIQPQANFSLLTFSFITSSKLAQFQDPIPVLESTLNLLSHGVVSCSIMISFDIAMIQNRFNFGENLRKYFRKFFFQQKFLNCSNFTFSSSIWAKSGTIGKEIAWGFRKWCWILISIKIRLRY